MFLPADFIVSTNQRVSEVKMMYQDGQPDEGTTERDGGVTNGNTSVPFKHLHPFTRRVSHCVCVFVCVCVCVSHCVCVVLCCVGLRSFQLL